MKGKVPAGMFRLISLIPCSLLHISHITTPIAPYLLSTPAPGLSQSRPGGRNIARGFRGVVVESYSLPCGPTASTIAALVSVQPLSFVFAISSYMPYLSTPVTIHLIKRTLPSSLCSLCAMSSDVTNLSTSKAFHVR